MSVSVNRRILLIDDRPAIHEDFRKILLRSRSTDALDETEALLFGERPAAAPEPYELDSAYQGQEGLEWVERSLLESRPYALAFVDVRMPPGWDGIETAEHLWRADPRLQIVICTAYSDYSWDEITNRLDAADRLLILKKPFDNIEVSQLARTLTAKWDLARRAEQNREYLEREVEKRMHELHATNKALLEHIQERQLAEQALRLKHQAIEASINAIFITNNTLPDNPIEYVNPAFQRMTGYTAMEAVGQGIGFLLCEGQGQRGVQELHRVMEQSGEGRTELLVHRKDGSALWCECYLAAIRTDRSDVTHFVIALNDISEAKRLEQQLRHRANYDALTELPNRSLMLEFMNRYIKVAARRQSQMSVAFVDLDHFKLINDTQGHEVGDQLLVEVARRLRENVRESDIVARLGGDEFVILLYPDAKVSDGRQMMQRIAECVACPISLLGQEQMVTCSIGISTFPQDGQDAETLLRHADTAMYKAKEGGRDNLQVFRPEMHELLRERMQLEADLRGALERSEFELYYQPQVDLVSGRIVGCEALIRWHHPVHGLILPGQFIPIAEQSDLILHIGEWTLCEACRQSDCWIKQQLPAVRMSVNISARQFDRQDVVGLVERILQQTRLDPQLLELEITEGLSMVNPDKTVQFIRQLKTLGVHIALDDFGMGYSNLSHLKHFQVEKLKLDHVFVWEMSDSRDSLAIPAAVIEMGHSLQMSVIAEGVETEQQLEMLRSLGCDQIQGFLFSHALSAEAFCELLRSGRGLDDQGYAAITELS